MARKANKSKPEKRGSGKALTDEDLYLWNYVLRDVTPIRSNRFTGFEEFAKKIPEKEISVPKERADPRKKAAALKHSPSSAPYRKGTDNALFRESVVPSSRQSVPGLDRNSSEKLRKGKMVIEGRVDLHGMNRRVAHQRLRSFLNGAYLQGKRCVLVITGKGSSVDKTDDAPYMGGGRRGILKEEVPKWLAEPDLQRLVLDYRTAQIKHGGAGALYVLMKRAR
ncbi:Smr/MutS family protein [Sneathiella sp.]|jgi:DNA-nicking Smr family endonuclease|uniref:Smr/MutS family protein n=1 Tax=Sneathiella sp. TaxID=1964365 RepID=UPI0039E3AE27